MTSGMIEIKEIEKLVELSRIALSDEEKADLRKDIESILTYVDQIKEASAISSEEKSEEKSVGVVRNVMREDSVVHQTGEFTEVLLAEAPRQEKGWVKVKKIL